ncbi:MAG: GIY-YIG nuclease family protein [Candidatus Berkelbacteria bacterium]|nr:GIY-YIG nuclease family protein [Candidatus Berkelbacteria bacterium]
MSIKSIEKLKLHYLPTGSGVYQFYDSAGKILYIGKAKNLRSRVKSYFQKSEDLLETRSEAIFQMVGQVARIKTVETDSEIEAVFLEAQLINQIKPKYNSRQKDDKSFYVIEISKDEVPRVELRRVRNVDLKNKKFYYFGPYPSGEIVKRALRILRKIFPFANCSETKFKRVEKLCKACLYGDINLCLAPCVASSPEVKEQIGYLKDFLSGKKQKVIRSLSKEMKSLSRMKKYEAAAIIRDKLFALEHLNRYSIGMKDSFDDFRSGSIFARIEAYDISNIGGDFAVGAMTVVSLGKIEKSEYKKFKIRTVSGSNDIAMMQEIIRRRFSNNWLHPNLLVIDGGTTHLKVVNSVLSELKISIPAISIAKGPDRNKDEFHYTTPEIGQYFLKNPELKNFAIIARDEAHRFSQSYYRKLHRNSLTNGS